MSNFEECFVFLFSSVPAAGLLHCNCSHAVHLIPVLGDSSPSLDTE